MAGASDILQQALENSGLTGTDNCQGTHSGAVSTTACTSIAIPRTTMTMTVHDTATGTTKRHIIRRVTHAEVFFWGGGCATCFCVTG